MKKDTTNHLSLLIGNLWLPNRNKIEELRSKYTLPSPDIGNIDVLTVEKQLLLTPSIAPVNYHIEAPQIVPVPVDTASKQIVTTHIQAPKPTISNNTEEPVQLINDWQQLQHLVSNCQDCKLCYGRKNTVLERGSRNARWMLIGEGPGEQEDFQGKPFVGASGQLLDKMITAMNLNPAQDVYIANVVKCRPPHNRNPDNQEIDSCKNYLFSQISLVNPQIIITLGRFAAQTLLKTELAVGKLRGRVNYYNNIPVIVTYHPSYLLRTPEAKKDAWADLQLAIKIYHDLGIST